MQAEGWPLKIFSHPTLPFARGGKSEPHLSSFFAGGREFRK